MSKPLPWPPEAARYPDDSVRRFFSPGSNWVLDFHGDPARAGLALYSDGNHHMALEAAVRAFLAANPEAGDVFYTTAPPAPLIDALRGDGLAIGNLRISRKPEVLIGPDDIVTALHADGWLGRHCPFAQSRGNVLLVRKGNPQGIASIGDLLADDVRLTCSNPVSEKASFGIYRDTVVHWAETAGVDAAALVEKLSVAGPRTLHSQVIHHREVPELIGSGQADAAVIYYHLALRYTRIFPDVFEFVDIGGILAGTADSGMPVTRYHVGLVADGGRWGEAFLSFMLTDAAQILYEEHGLARPY